MPALLPRCAVRPAWSCVSPGPHSKAQQSCLRVASPSHGSMAVAWTRAVMGSGRVRVSLGACMSKAAWKAPRFCARMGPGSHDQAWAVLGSLSSSVKALYYMGLEPAVVCRQMSQSQRRLCQCTHLVAVQALNLLELLPTTMLQHCAVVS